MNDLLTSMQEAVEEREAIKAADGIAFDEEKRHRCEVSWCMRTFYPRHEEAKEYFALVEKRRGKDMADKLRDSVRESWKARKLEMEGQA